MTPYIHTNKGKLNCRAVKVVFLGYPMRTIVIKFGYLMNINLLCVKILFFNELMFYKDLFTHR